jgi:NADH-quinone oxidoreductase subunit N
VVIAIGTMISLAYYLRVVAAVWMRPSAEPAPAMAGGSPEADETEATAPPPGTRCLAIILPAVGCAAATVFFGVIPSPLVDWASHAGSAISVFL